MPAIVRRLWYNGFLVVTRLQGGNAGLIIGHLREGGPLYSHYYFLVVVRNLGFSLPCSRLQNAALTVWRYSLSFLQPSVSVSYK